MLRMQRLDNQRIIIVYTIRSEIVQIYTQPQTVDIPIQVHILYYNDDTQLSHYVSTNGGHRNVWKAPSSIRIRPHYSEDR